MTSIANNPLFKRGIAIALVIFIVDQISKWWILEVFDLPSKRIVEILPFFNLAMVWNAGVSFGLFAANSDAARWFLIGFTSLVAVIVAVWLWKADRPLIGWALALVLGGAIGNIVDRIRYGAVADFIQLHAAGYSFYVFNVADAAISIGVALLLLDAIVSGREDSKSKQ